MRFEYFCSFITLSLEDGMRYSIFIEQKSFQGVTSRPFQQTIAIDAANDAGALRDARYFVEDVFATERDAQYLRAHIQRSDGTVLEVIEYSREKPL